MAYSLEETSFGLYPLAGAKTGRPAEKKKILEAYPGWEGGVPGLSILPQLQGRKKTYGKGFLRLEVSEKRA